MNILVLGGTGSLGSELTRFFSSDENKDWVEKVTVFSRDAHKQAALRAQVSPDRVNFILGDICDYAGLERACKDQRIVIHTAALKYVSDGERQVNEFVRVNIDGSLNVIRACQSNNIGSVLFISSDKAVDPINLYGRTKAVGEDLFVSNGYSVLRYGNVVNSNGSFLHVWKDQIQKRFNLELRQPEPTRFFLTIEDAVNLVEDALTRLTPGAAVYVPANLRSFSIWDAFLCTGYPHSKETDLLPGEKKDEVLVSDHENGVVVSKYLAKVTKGYAGELDRAQYCSLTAPRLSEKFLYDFVKGILNASNR